MLQNELKKISEQITSIIKSDDYYRGIEPLFLRNAVADYPLRAGKRLRPALLLWICGLFGGDLRKAGYAAAAVEVYHNWTLVHDDIIDNDDTRRGQPTSHVQLSAYGRKAYKLEKERSLKFGSDFAMLAGDLQNSWANSLLLKTTGTGVPAEITASICKDLFDDTTRELICGEALDVDFSYRKISGLSIREVARMIYLKTGVLLNFSAKAGAKIALNTTDSNHPSIRNIVRFTTDMGTAFQLRDDWLGIYGDAEKFGKPIGSDIRSAKPTVLVLEALGNLSRNDKKTLTCYLGNPGLSDKDMEDVRRIITESGAEKKVLENISKLKNDAEKTMMSFPDNKYRQLLLELNNYLLSRKS